MKIETNETRQALAAYDGSVTHCRPGRARGRRIRPSKPKNEAVTWLQQQPHGGWLRGKPNKAQRQAERQRIAECNEALRKQRHLRKGEVG